MFAHHSGPQKERASRFSGFNPGGFGLRTRRFIYVNFIRPVLEYGLAVFPEAKLAIEELQKAQGRALCAMFGVGKNTSRLALETLAGVTEMQYRHSELKARWLNRVRCRDENHMTRIVQGQQSMVSRGRKSCFSDIEHNHILQYHDLKVLEEKKNHEASGKRTRYYPRRIDVSILEKRCEQLKNRRDQTKRCGHFPVYSDCKARFMYTLSRQPRPVVNTVIKWATGQYIGKPRRCLGCKIERADTSHLIKCSGAGDINWLIGKRKWRQAIEEIAKVFNITKEYSRLASSLRLLDLCDDLEDSIVITD